MTRKTSSITSSVVPRCLAPSGSALLIIIAFTVALAQQPIRKLAKVEVEGLARLSAAEVIATSGLKTGARFSVEDVDAGGQRLVDSGLFAKVGYRTITKGDLVTVIFQVEETKGGQSLVVFDNFVWFTPEELSAAIKREVPSFNGMAADSGNMTDLISHALQTLLKERGIGGMVEYAPWQSQFTGPNQEHLFSVSGVAIPICELHFPGAKDVPEDKLVESSRELAAADYSLKSAIAFPNFVLFPIYREAGHLRAKFAEPLARFPGGDKCQNGVALSIPVIEGSVYLWDKAEWRGNEALAPAELDAALGMKEGEIANGIKFDQGLVEVENRYGHSGHLDVSLEAKPVFDEATSRVTFQIAVKEGPQYRMGKLLVKGLSAADAHVLEEKWKLKSGEIFDSSYSQKFFKSDAGEEIQRIIDARQVQGKSRPQIDTAVAPNRLTLSADVTLEFKD
jgi:outer membrane protein assembly factor BamA